MENFFDLAAKDDEVDEGVDEALGDAVSKVDEACGEEAAAKEASVGASPIMELSASLIVKSSMRIRGGGGGEGGDRGD